VPHKTAAKPPQIAKTPTHPPTHGCRAGCPALELTCEGEELLADEDVDGAEVVDGLEVVDGAMELEVEEEVVLGVELELEVELELLDEDVDVTEAVGLEEELDEALDEDVVEAETDVGAPALAAAHEQTAEAEACTWRAVWAPQPLTTQVNAAAIIAAD